MPSLRLFVPPILEPIKKGDEVEKWSRSLVQELDRGFEELSNYMMPFTGVGRRSHLTLTAGFTIDEDGLVVTIDSAGAVTSSLTTAIKDGDFGEWLLIVNIGTFSITIKDNANTKLGGDKVLAANGTLMVVWNGTDWCVV